VKEQASTAGEKTANIIEGREALSVIPVCLCQSLSRPPALPCRVCGLKQSELFNKGGAYNNSCLGRCDFTRF
jgi:hypothetical protein